MPKWRRRLAEAESALRQQVLAARLQREQARLDRWYCKMSRALCPEPRASWACRGTPLLGHAGLCPRSNPQNFLAWVSGGADAVHVEWVGRCAFAFTRTRDDQPPAATRLYGTTSHQRNGQSQSPPSASASHLVTLADVLLAPPIELPEAVVSDSGAMAAIRGCVKALDQAAKSNALEASVQIDPANGMSAVVPFWPQSASWRNRPCWPQTELTADSLVVRVLREICHFHPRVDHPVTTWDAFGPSARFRTLVHHSSSDAAPMPCALHPGVQLPDIFEALAVPGEWHRVRAVQNLVVHTERSLALSIPGAVGCVPISCPGEPNQAARWVPLFTLGDREGSVSRETLLYLADLAAPAGERLPAPVPLDGLSDHDMLRLSGGMRTRRDMLGRVVCRALQSAGSCCWTDGPQHVHRAGRARERARARDHAEHQALMDLVDEDGWDAAKREEHCGLRLRDIFTEE